MSADELIAGLEAMVRRDVSRETLDRLLIYERLLREEAKRQNLVSSSTLGALWHRHILDSAQLVKYAPSPVSSWADIGSGAGLPGVVISSLTEGPMVMIEPRRLRADFLHKVVEQLGLNAEVVMAKAERAAGKFDVITARAVSNLSKLFEISAHLSTRKTVWALPKGRSAPDELAEAKNTWQGVFHVEHSATDPESRIIVATGVSKR